MYVWAMSIIICVSPKTEVQQVFIDSYVIHSNYIIYEQIIFLSSEQSYERIRLPNTTLVNINRSYTLYICGSCYKFQLMRCTYEKMYKI